MDASDVLVVGVGPAGSSCAHRLSDAGIAVAVLDHARFPRDKVCAGWITPAVVDALNLDLDAHARTHTLQSLTGFPTGTFDGPMRLVDFGQPISYGIRRCEFDRYLLERSGATRLTGQRLNALRRDSDRWVANEAIRARVVVGAGEEILAAVESGQMAADAILAAGPQYAAARLEAYPAAIDRPFGPCGASSNLAKMPGWMTALLSRALFASPWLTRRVLIEDGFLHLRR